MGQDCSTYWATGVSRSSAQKIVEEKKKAQDEQQQPKQPPSSTLKVSLDDFDQGVVRRTIAAMYSLKKVLPTLEGAQWLSGRVLDSRPKGRGFEPHRRHCVVVLEQDTFILA